MYKGFIVICSGYVIHPNYQYFQSVYDNNLFYLENAYNMEIRRVTDIYTQTMQETDDDYQVRAKELNWDVDRCQEEAVKAWCENPTREQALICDNKYKEFSQTLNIYTGCLREHKERKGFLEKQYREIISKLGEQRLVNIENLQYYHAVWVKSQIYYLQNAGYSYVGNS